VDVEKKLKIKDRQLPTSRISRNIKKQGADKALPMFYVELKSESNNKDIYDLVRSLFQCKVKFESPHSKREISQCNNCQRYGYTRSFCFRKARGIKCAEDHPTSNCPCKGKFKDVKCLLAKTITQPITKVVWSIKDL